MSRFSAGPPNPNLAPAASVSSAKPAAAAMPTQQFLPADFAQMEDGALDYLYKIEEPASNASEEEKKKIESNNNRRKKYKQQIDALASSNKSVSGINFSLDGLVDFLKKSKKTHESSTRLTSLDVSILNQIIESKNKPLATDKSKNCKNLDERLSYIIDKFYIDINGEFKFDGVNPSENYEKKIYTNEIILINTILEFVREKTRAVEIDELKIYLVKLCIEFSKEAIDKGLLNSKKTTTTRESQELSQLTTEAKNKFEKNWRHITKVCDKQIEALSSSKSTKARAGSSLGGARPRATSFAAEAARSASSLSAPRSRTGSNTSLASLADFGPSDGAPSSDDDSSRSSPPRPDSRASTSDAVLAIESGKELPSKGTLNYALQHPSTKPLTLSAADDQQSSWIASREQHDALTDLFKKYENFSLQQELKREHRAESPIPIPEVFESASIILGTGRGKSFVSDRFKDEIFKKYPGVEVFKITHNTTKQELKMALEKQNFIIDIDESRQFAKYHAEFLKERYPDYENDLKTAQFLFLQDLKKKNFVIEWNAGAAESVLDFESYETDIQLAQAKAELKVSQANQELRDKCESLKAQSKLLKDKIKDAKDRKEKALATLSKDNTKFGEELVIDKIKKTARKSTNKKSKFLVTQHISNHQEIKIKDDNNDLSQEYKDLGYDIIIFPVKKDGKMSYEAFIRINNQWKTDNDFMDDDRKYLSDSNIDSLYKALLKHFGQDQPRVYLAYDKENCVGGDYGLFSYGDNVVEQFFDIKHDPNNPTTSEELMQLVGRHRNNEGNPSQSVKREFYIQGFTKSGEASDDIFTQFKQRGVIRSDEEFALSELLTYVSHAQDVLPQTVSLPEKFVKGGSEFGNFDKTTAKEAIKSNLAQSQNQEEKTKTLQDELKKLERLAKALGGSDSGYNSDDGERLKRYREDNSEAQFRYVKSQLERVQAELEELRKQVGIKTGEPSTQIREMVEKARQYDVLLSRFQELERKLQDAIRVRDEVAKYAKNAGEDKSRAEAEKIAAERSREVAEEENKKLSEENDNLRDQMAALQEQKTQLEQNIAGLERANDSLKNKQGELEAELSNRDGLEAENEKLRRQLNKLQSDLQQSQAEQTKLNRTLQSKTEEAGTLARQNEELTKQNKALDEEKLRLKTENNDFNRRQSEYENKDELLKNLQEENTQLKSDLHVATDDNFDMQFQFQQIVADLGFADSAAKNKADLIKGKIEELRKEYNELKANNNKLSEEKDKLEEENKNAAEKLSRAVNGRNSTDSNASHSDTAFMDLDSIADQAVEELNRARREREPALDQSIAEDNSTRLQQAEDENRRLQQELEKLQRQAQDLDGSEFSENFSDTSQELEWDHNGFPTKSATPKITVEGIKEILALIQQRLDEISQAGFDVVQENSDIKRQIDNINSAINSLNTALNSGVSLVDDLQSKLFEIKDKLSQLIDGDGNLKLPQELKDEFSALQQKLEEKIDKLPKPNSKEEIAAQVQTKLQPELEALKQQKDDLASQMAELNAAIASLNEARTQAETAKTQADAAKDATNTERLALELQKTRAAEQAAETERQRTAAAEAELNRQRGLINEQQKALLATNTELANVARDLKNELATLRTELQTERSNAAQERERFEAQLQQNNAERIRQLNEAKEKFDTANAQLTDLLNQLNDLKQPEQEDKSDENSDVELDDNELQAVKTRVDEILNTLKKAIDRFNTTNKTQSTRFNSKIEKLSRQIQKIKKTLDQDNLSSTAQGDVNQDAKIGTIASGIEALQTSVGDILARIAQMQQPPQQGGSAASGGTSAGSGAGGHDSSASAASAGGATTPPPPSSSSSSSSGGGSADGERDSSSERDASGQGGHSRKGGSSNLAEVVAALNRIAKEIEDFQRSVTDQLRQNRSQAGANAAAAGDGSQLEELLFTTIRKISGDFTAALTETSVDNRANLRTITTQLSQNFAAAIAAANDNPTIQMAFTTIDKTLKALQNQISPQQPSAAAAPAFNNASVLREIAKIADTFLEATKAELSSIKALLSEQCLSDHEKYKILNEQLTRERNASTDQLNKQRDSLQEIIDNQATNNNANIAKIRDELTQALQALRDERVEAQERHAAELRRLSTEHGQRLEELRVGNQNTINALNRANDVRAREVEVVRNDEIARITQQNATRAKEAKTEHAAAIARIEAQNTNALERQEASNRVLVDELRDQNTRLEKLHGEVVASFESAKQELKDRLEARITEQEAANQRLIAEKDAQIAAANAERERADNKNQSMLSQMYQLHQESMGQIINAANAMTNELRDQNQSMAQQMFALQQQNNFLSDLLRQSAQQANEAQQNVMDRFIQLTQQIADLAAARQQVPAQPAAAAPVVVPAGPQAPAAAAPVVPPVPAAAAAAVPAPAPAATNPAVVPAVPLAPVAAPAAAPVAPLAPAPAPAPAPQPLDYSEALEDAAKIVFPSEFKKGGNEKQNSQTTVLLNFVKVLSNGVVGRGKNNEIDPGALNCFLAFVSQIKDPKEVLDLMGDNMSKVQKKQKADEYLRYCESNGTKIGQFLIEQRIDEHESLKLNTVNNVHQDYNITKAFEKLRLDYDLMKKPGAAPFNPAGAGLGGDRNQVLVAKP